MADLLNSLANAMLAVLSLAFIAVLVFVALWVPWWLSVPGAVALVAAWPAHKRWMRRAG